MATPLYILKMKNIGGMSTLSASVPVTMKANAAPKHSFLITTDKTTSILRSFVFLTRMDQNDGRVVSNFIVQALKNENITIYGDGSQTRSFCYCSDLIDGMIKMMATNDNRSEERRV